MFVALTLLAVVPGAGSQEAGTFDCRGVASSFEEGPDGWRTPIGDPVAEVPEHVADGGAPGGYLTNQDAGRGGVWYWSAPGKFLGDQEQAYQGTLSFSLRQNVHDEPYDDRDILLIGTERTLFHEFGGPGANPGTDWTRYEVPMREGAWHAVNGTLDEQVFRSVLADLEGLVIQGEYNNGTGRSSLDSVCLSEVPHTPASGSPTCDTVRSPTTGHRYCLTPTVESWEEAQQIARSLGGHLAAITSEAENRLVADHFGDAGRLWIGLEKTDGSWRWTTGEPVEYENWAPGEPNNYSPCAPEDKGVFNWERPGDWNDLSSECGPDWNVHRGLVEAGSRKADGLCAPREVSSSFAPVQAVFQDDPVFPDDEGRQLARLGPRSWEAQLPMVRDKPAVLLGPQGHRTTISYRGAMGGTSPVDAEVAFHLEQGDRVEELTTVDVGELPLAPPCEGSRAKDEAVVVADRGLPRDQAFTFQETGPYRITAVLQADNGTPVPGSEVTVEGEVVSTRAPPVVLMAGDIDREPVMDPSHPASVLPALTNVSSMAREFEARAPGYLPVPPGGMQVQARNEPLAIAGDSSAAEDADRVCRALAQDYGGQAPEWCREDISVAIVTAQLYRSPVPFDEVRGMVVLPDPTFDRFFDGLAAVAVHERIAYLRAHNDHWTLSHELAHTVPEFPSLAEPTCGRDFHNNASIPYGAGFRVTLEGREDRVMRTERVGVMGPDIEPPDHWIEQCTYATLLDGFREHATQPETDAPTVTISGWIVDDPDNDTSAGDMGPAFTTDRPPEEPGGAGPYELAFLGDGGGELSVHGFDPSFTMHTSRPHGEIPTHAAPFGLQVDIPDSATELELRGPDGVLDTRNVSAHAPGVEITNPVDGGTAPLRDGRIQVEWQATDADGDDLVYQVAYSPDGGETWRPVVSQTRATTVSINETLLAGEGDHRVSVRASDGVRGDVDVVGFAVDGFPAPEVLELDVTPEDDQARLTLRTADESVSTVVLETPDGRRTLECSSEYARVHECVVGDLDPGERYRLYVQAEDREELTRYSHIQAFETTENEGSGGGLLFWIVVALLGGAGYHVWKRRQDG